MCLVLIVFKMSGKRKTNNFLTFRQKNKLLEKVKLGESKENIMREFNISQVTYWRLLKNKKKVLDKFGSDNCENLARKSTKTSNNKELDEAVITWFQQVRSRGDPISGLILKEKALSLSKLLNPTSTFKASDGWLQCFKKRYGITFLEMRGETRMSNDEESTREFSNYLQGKVNRENLISSSEALESLMKLKTYMTARNFLREHLVCLEEIKSIIEEKL